MLRLDERRSLRHFREGDTAELHRLIDANRTDLAIWTPWAAEQTLEGTLDFIRSSERARSARTAFEYAICEDGAIVGGAGLSRVDWGYSSGNIGYWLAVRARGRGTATMAAAALVRHAFGELSLNRVELRAEPGNTASRAVAERLGFTPEGTLREAGRIGSRYVDHVVYRLLAREWALRA